LRKHKSKRLLHSYPKLGSAQHQKRKICVATALVKFITRRCKHTKAENVHCAKLLCVTEQDRGKKGQCWSAAGAALWGESRKLPLPVRKRAVTALQI